ncbi:hypothetical protein ADK52_03655 [Streptomyces sp. WM6372]|uniref:hypothetical protein n=1 Tax=Streptomyces sp. WM6372 TaxID=1415555 RepID=UPI0006AFE765|nr:hypothetical protein [Streptomyces sp. WM6372]KOU31091.1 hypothetical protein ADK52_03655 [Streptomyces sp. WM6372]
MSLEDQPAQLPGPAGADPVLSAGLGIAAQWGEALGGPEKLQVALKALEPQLRREHELSKLRLERQEADAARKAAAEEAEAQRRAHAVEREKEREAGEQMAARNHKHRMRLLHSAVALSVLMLGGGLYAMPTNGWIAGALCGPSLLSLLRIFVLRRSTDADVREAGRSARGAGNAPPPI